MPRPKQTPEEIAAMRTRILNAATELALQKGPGALTIRSIAEQLGVSHMVLYSYFKNRDDLMQTLSERQQKKLKHQLDFALQRSSENATCDIVHEWLSFYSRVARSHPHLYEITWGPSARPKHIDMQEKQFKTQIENLSQLLAIGMERGEFFRRDPLLASSTATIMVNAPLIVYFSGRGHQQNLLNDIADETVKAAMCYLCSSSNIEKASTDLFTREVFI